MTENIKLGIIMDPLDAINPKKDSTFAMIKAASVKNWSIHCTTSDNLFVNNSNPYALFNTLKFNSSLKPSWFTIEQPCEILLSDLDIILIRKDPPFNMEYIYLTYILDLVKDVTLIANNPTAIRNNNEKLSTLNFSNVTPPNLVTANKQKLLEFIQEYKSIIVKPLDGMGGRSIFKINYGDDNSSVILDTLTKYGTNTILAQKFIPEISKGDKRILLINGEPVPYGLARVPAKGEFRGNLAAGAQGVGFELSKRDHEICEYLGPELRKQGLYFVGIDVIGDYLTEVNVTSPTCIQEIDKAYNTNIADTFLDNLEKLI